MDKLQTILASATAVLGFVLTVLIPFAIKIGVALKKGKAKITQSDEDRKRAEIAEQHASKMLEMTKVANEIIESLEKNFATQDALLKSFDPSSRTLGSVKKECALARLSEYATQIGVEFNREYWSNEIDEIVRLTRNVNAKAAA